MTHEVMKQQAHICCM